MSQLQYHQSMGRSRHRKYCALQLLMHDKCVLHPVWFVSLILKWPFLRHACKVVGKILGGIWYDLFCSFCPTTIWCMSINLIQTFYGACTQTGCMNQVVQMPNGTWVLIMNLTHRHSGLLLPHSVLRWELPHIYLPLMPQAPSLGDALSKGIDPLWPLLLQL